MIAGLAVVLCGVLGLIAVSHAWWALGGVWPARDAAALARGVVGDGRARMPPAGVTWLVVLALAVVAAWPLLLAGIVAPPLPSTAVRTVGWLIVAVFLSRGIAGYVPAWRRRFHAEPFATRDVAVFSPLCLILAAGFAAVLSLGVRA